LPWRLCPHCGDSIGIAAIRSARTVVGDPDQLINTFLVTPSNQDVPQWRLS
jgi:hypothetical protein